MKKLSASVLLFLCICTIALGQGPKYIFFFIGDGLSMNGVYGTELYNAAIAGETEPQALNFSAFPYRGFVTTYCTDAMVTDSAAAGTALSCGQKTFTGAEGLDKDGKPIANITEKMKEMGYGTGIVTTVGINHATPAAFTAHRKDRNDYDGIMHDLIDGNAVDFAAGGGIIDHSKRKHSGEYWKGVAEKAGWNVLVGDECKSGATDCKRTICVYSLVKNQIPFAVEKKEGIRLEDLTRAAVENLSIHHPDAFFMMVEGGRIDYGAHARDAVTMFQETNDMAKAVDVALELYRQHPDETLILVTSDHETGGFTLGCGDSYAIRPEYLLWQTTSKNEITKMLGKLRKKGARPVWEDAKDILRSTLGLWDHVSVSEQAEAQFREIFDRTIAGMDSQKDVNLYSEDEMLAGAAVDYLDNRAGTRFMFGSHSGGLVPVYAIGVGADKIARCKDNTDFFGVILELARQR